MKEYKELIDNSTYMYIYNIRPISILFRAHRDNSNHSLYVYLHYITEEHVNLTDESIHVLGALLKDFLRSVPGGILMSSRYTEFVATNDISDTSMRVQHIQR